MSTKAKTKQVPFGDDKQERQLQKQRQKQLQLLLGGEFGESSVRPRLRLGSATRGRRKEYSFGAWIAVSVEAGWAVEGWSTWTARACGFAGTSLTSGAFVHH